MSDFDQEFDLIIVGSGGGAMCAALVAAARGLRAVILEKTDQVGGSTAMSGGILWIPGSRLAREDGVTDSVEQGLLYLNHLVGEPGPGSTAARKRAYVEQGVALLDFLQQQGVRLRRIVGYPDYYDELPGGCGDGRAIAAELFDLNRLGRWKRRLRTGLVPSPMALDEAGSLGLIMRSWKARWVLVRILFRGLLQILTRRHWVGAGNALQGQLLRAVLAAGVEVRTHAAVERLMTVDDSVVGVESNQGGQRLRLGARRGVLLNTGGFSHNLAMRERHQPAPSSIEWTRANPGDTGEMIAEAARIGAALDAMDESWWTAAARPPGARLPEICIADMGKPHCLLVDGDGQRFVNEAASYMEVGQAMYRRHRMSRAIPSWLILDRRHRQRYLLAGALPGWTPQSWLDSGFIKRADSLAGLAQLCSIDPPKLEATVQRFNTFAERGADEDFHRGARRYDQWYADPTHTPVPTLGTLEQPPFYALPLYPGDVGTAGGIVTDEHARALRADGSVIGGLYATGNCTASVMGRRYPGPGASIGASCVFGYIAAQHLCQFSPGGA